MTETDLSDSEERELSIEIADCKNRETWNETAVLLDELGHLSLQLAGKLRNCAPEVLDFQPVAWFGFRLWRKEIHTGAENLKPKIEKLRQQMELAVERSST